jgi:hypothetical protein
MIGAIAEAKEKPKPGPRESAPESESEAKAGPASGDVLSEKATSGLNPQAVVDRATDTHES